jgi:transcriptional regulator with XRE-family HTH domain
MSFGRILAQARKKANLSQKELAAKIKKEDEQPISAQYLNDIEHDRRNPPSGYLLEQFARELNIPVEYLYYWAGELPADLKGSEANQEQVVAAYRAFRKELKKQS